MVRATIDNKEGLFKPEMFASVTIYAGGDHNSVGVHKQALIYEGQRVRLWVATDKSLELRNIETGLINGDYVEVRSNLKPGERVVVKGRVFIDRGGFRHLNRVRDRRSHGPASFPLLSNAVSRTGSFVALIIGCLWLTQRRCKLIFGYTKISPRALLNVRARYGRAPILPGK